MNLREGSRTPWGAAQDVDLIAPGVWLVSTAGHGGIKLDRVRNAKVPASCRTKGGWYEEDCEVSIVFAVHRDTRSYFKADNDQIVKSLSMWLPDCYVTLRDAGFVTATAEAEQRLAKEMEDRRKRQHARENKIPLRCSAKQTDADENRIHVLFRVPDQNETIGYFMDRGTYDAIPIMTPASPDDYRQHGTLEPAPNSYY